MRAYEYISRATFGRSLCVLCCFLSSSGLLWPASALATQKFPKTNWRVGQWAHYQLTSPQGKTSTIKIGIAGWKWAHQELHYWIEVQCQSKKDPLIIKQLLGMDGISHNSIIQHGARAPQQLDAFQWPHCENQFSLKHLFRFIKKTKYHAGPLVILKGWPIQQALSFRGDWFAPEVPIMGLVRGDDPELGRLTLTAHGYNGYRSRIKDPVLRKK